MIPEEMEAVEASYDDRYETGEFLEVAFADLAPEYEGEKEDGGANLIVLHEDNPWACVTVISEVDEEREMQVASTGLTPAQVEDLRDVLNEILARFKDQGHVK